MGARDRQPNGATDLTAAGGMGANRTASARIICAVIPPITAITMAANTVCSLCLTMTQPPFFFVGVPCGSLIKARFNFDFDPTLRAVP
jgi:hypothetical protein